MKYQYILCIIINAKNTAKTRELFEFQDPGNLNNTVIVVRGLVPGGAAMMVSGDVTVLPAVVCRCQ